MISGPIQNMFAAWDILNFDPTDSSQAILGVDQVILERLEVPHLPYFFSVNASLVLILIVAQRICIKCQGLASVL